MVFAVLAMLLLVHPAADPADNKDNGIIFQPRAEFFFYPGKWSPDLDIDKLTPVYWEEEGLLAFSRKV